MAIGVLLTPPIIQFFGNNGQPAVNGTVLTQVGGINTATYQDVGLTTPLPNPIPLNSRGEVSSSNGVSSQCFLTPNTVYTFTLLDSGGNQLWAASYVNGLQLTLTALGQLLYPQTVAEAAAVITPFNYYIPPGNVLRYGTNAVPGTTDMTAAIQASLNQAAQPSGISCYVPAGSYALGSILSIGSNVQMYGDGPATVLNFSSTANVDNLNGTNVTNTYIHDLKVNCTGVISGVGGSYVGVIALRGATNCKIERCEVTGGFLHGIVLAASSTNAAVYNRVTGCYIHGTTNSTQDGSDIHLDCTAAAGASYNVIDGNQCFGNGNWHGISVLASANPNLAMTRNVITNNRIGFHATYGIILYTHTPIDTYTQVIGNYIENIQGTGLSGAGGTGIYVAGMGACTISNNVLVNCCVLSSVQFNQGGITLLAPLTGGASTVTGNSIFDMAPGNSNAINMPGINVITAGAGTVVSGNVVSQQVAGGGSSYIGIEIQGGNTGTTLSGNTVNILNTNTSTRGIFVYANNANITNVTVTGNNVLGCSSRGISFEQLGGSSVSNFTVSGNVLQNGSSTSTPLNIVSGNNGAITGNTASATTGAALILSTSTNVCVTANTLSSTGGTTVSMVGTCTGSLVNETNILNGLLNNASTGAQAKQRSAVSPQTLTAASLIGDISYNTAGATPFAWQCTVTGTPGTWQALAIP